MPKPKSIDDPQLRDKNTVAELHESQNKSAKSRIKNSDRAKQLEQVKEWLEKIRKS